MNGLWITARGQCWLDGVRNGRSARILHLFDEVCNLVTEYGELLSLVSMNIGAGPFALVIDAHFTSALHLQQPIFVTETQLQIGSLVIQTDTAQTWNARPDWQTLRHQLDWPLPKPLPAPFAQPVRQLLQAIHQQDEAQVQEMVTFLAGRGTGLTPTGDDLLVGVLYGLWVHDLAEKWAGLIVETAVPRTTTLSGAFLQAAGQGEAVQAWHDVVNGTPNAIQKLQAIGHASGKEMWAGFCLAMSWYQKS